MSKIKGKYRFTRSANSVSGFFSKNRASTDALAALTRWREMGTARDFEVHDDQDHEIVATLTFDKADQGLGAEHLDALCHEYGVERTYIP